MQLKDKKVMVFGAAKSGVSSAELLRRIGAFVILYDGNTNLSMDDFSDKLATDEMFLFLTGHLSDEVLDTLDLMIISPGVPCDHPTVVRIKEKNIPIWGEIELAYHYSIGTIIGITGTNGKTTTTTLVGKIMKAYFDEVYIVGNIGNTYTDIALNTSDRSVIVIELSSFQLETIDRFKPKISTILNITPDHLDRHHTMEEYISMKERIAMNQTMTELCILNYEDKTLRDMATRLNTRVLFFSSLRELEEGIYLEDEDICYSYDGNHQIICNTAELHIIGRHNHENVMAAAGIAIHAGVPLDVIRKVIINFKGVEHRIEYVDTIHQVAYYNDSKGTNPDASVKAILAMRKPTILIAGGYDKKVPFDDWIETFRGRVKLLVLIGQTKKQIARTARKHGFTEIILANSLEDAVRISAENANEGDAVLLSPACASWDMFRDFEQRGNLFKQYISDLK